MVKRGRRNNSDCAYAEVLGSGEYPKLRGMVKLCQMQNGVLVTAEIYGLPSSGEKCAGGIFAFHIHEGGSCSGTKEEPFANAKGHYNPDGCKHPYHAGDMPPLFENNGYAYLSFFTNRFTVEEIIGRTVIIHEKPDDFISQPSGNPGKMIACGVIMR